MEKAIDEVTDTLRRRRNVPIREPNNFLFAVPGGAETDIVLEKPNGSVAAIEIKASQTAGASDFRALKAMRDQIGGLFRSGVVFYLGDQILPFGDRLWLLPIQALWAS